MQQKFKEKLEGKKENKRSKRDPSEENGINIVSTPIAS